MIRYGNRVSVQCQVLMLVFKVEGIFRSAKERQLQFEQGRKAGSDSSDQICCVTLDEAGLPNEDKQPLKVLHYYLENPIVSSVILTNSILDAAKTNRTVRN